MPHQQWSRVWPMLQQCKGNIFTPMFRTYKEKETKRFHAFLAANKDMSHNYKIEGHISEYIYLKKNLWGYVLGVRRENITEININQNFIRLEPL